MLIIPAGTYELWPHFSLQIPQPLTLSPEHHYYLEGDNGSGKSTFIKKLLLPQLKANAGIYSLYWEQQIGLQSYAIRAHAAFNHHEQRLETDYDILMYLLDNLKNTLLRQKRPVFFVVDECLFFDDILRYLKAHELEVSLIFTHHGGFHDLDKLRIFQFTAATPALGIIHENPA